MGHFVPACRADHDYGLGRAHAGSQRRRLAKMNAAKVEVSIAVTI